jgi:hypothetical protein
MEKRFSYLAEIRWDKKTQKISFIDGEGRRWEGYGNIQVRGGDKVSIIAEVWSVTDDSTVL